MRLHGWPGPAGCSSIAPMGTFSIARCGVPSRRGFRERERPAREIGSRRAAGRRPAATRENDVSGSRRPIPPHSRTHRAPHESRASLDREGASHDARSTRAGVAGGTRGVRVRVGARTRPVGSGESTPPPRVPQSAIEPRRGVPAPRVRSCVDARVQRNPRPRVAVGDQTRHGDVVVLRGSRPRRREHFAFATRRGRRERESDVSSRGVVRESSGVVLVSGDAVSGDARVHGGGHQRRERPFVAFLRRPRGLRGSHGPVVHQLAAAAGRDRQAQPAARARHGRQRATRRREQRATTEAGRRDLGARREATRRFRRRPSEDGRVRVRPGGGARPGVAPRGGRQRRRDRRRRAGRRANAQIRGKECADRETRRAARWAQERAVRAARRRRRRRARGARRRRRADVANGAGGGARGDHARLGGGDGERRRLLAAPRGRARGPA